jgi:hypothetical protein
MSNYNLLRSHLDSLNKKSITNPSETNRPVQRFRGCKGKTLTLLSDKITFNNCLKMNKSWLFIHVPFPLTYRPIKRIIWVILQIIRSTWHNLIQKLVQIYNKWFIMPLHLLNNHIFQFNKPLNYKIKVPSKGLCHLSASRFP